MSLAWADRVLLAGLVATAGAVAAAGTHERAPDAVRALALAAATVRAVLGV